MISCRHQSLPYNTAPLPVGTVKGGEKNILNKKPTAADSRLGWVEWGVQMTEGRFA